MSMSVEPDSAISPQQFEDVAAALGGALTSHSELLVAGLSRLESSAGQMSAAADSQHQDVQSLERQVADLSHNLIRAHDRLTDELKGQVHDLQGVVAKSLEAANAVLEAALDQAGRHAEPSSAMAEIETASFNRIAAVEAQVHAMGEVVAAIARAVGAESAVSPADFTTHTRYEFDENDEPADHGPATPDPEPVLEGEEEVVVFSVDPNETYVPPQPVVEAGEYRFAGALALAQQAEGEATVIDLDPMASLRPDAPLTRPAQAFGSAAQEVADRQDEYVIPETDEYY